MAQAGNSPWWVPGGKRRDLAQARWIFYHVNALTGKLGLPGGTFANNACVLHPMYHQVRVLHVTTVCWTDECRVTRFHINRTLVCPGKASNSVNRVTRLHINRQCKLDFACCTSHLEVTDIMNGLKSRPVMLCISVVINNLITNIVTTLYYAFGGVIVSVAVYDDNSICAVAAATSARTECWRLRADNMEHFQPRGLSEPCWQGLKMPARECFFSIVFQCYSLEPFS